MMKTNAKVARLGEAVLTQVDNLAYNLDKYGVENTINRHTLIAGILFGQKRFEGELDSLKARTGSTKANLNDLLATAEQFAKSGLSLAAFPATYSYSRLKALV